MAEPTLPSRTARRSFLGPTLFAIFGIALLVGLGTWQVQRLHWKEGLIAERNAAWSRAPAPLPASRAAAQALEFRPVRVAGRFRNATELYLHAIAGDGTAGYHVLTPLFLADGRALLVDRGFVPAALKDPARRAAGDPAGAVTVTGLVRLPARHGFFVPDNRPANDEWFFVDLPAMAQAAGTPLLPFYLDADATPNPGGYPQGAQTDLALPNNHLQYALTWYGLAATLLIFYILLLRRRRAPGDAQ